MRGSNNFDEFIDSKADDGLLTCWFDENGTDRPATGQLSNFIDDLVANPEHHVARRLGAIRVLEGAKMNADPMWLPGVMALGEIATRGCRAITESNEGASQIGELDVESGVDNGRRGEHARRNSKPLTLEALGDHVIQSDHDNRSREAGHKTRAAEQP